MVQLRSWSGAGHWPETAESQSRNIWLSLWKSNQVMRHLVSLALCNLRGILVGELGTRAIIQAGDHKVETRVLLPIQAGTSLEGSCVPLLQLSHFAI